MSKGLEVNVEMGLCTKEMAKENPIKDFEILVEEYKDKWSKQMYDYFKECLNEIKKKLTRLEELEKAFDALSKDDEKAKKLLSKEIEKNMAFEIIKDRLIVIDKGKYIEVFCEFSIPSKSKKYNLLKETLL